jgi:heterodisulfide reductase subunit A
MEEQRIGVYVCWCGSNIAKMVDVVAVAKEMEKLPGVVIAKDYKYMCSDPGQDLIIKDIKEHNLNRVVVAACSPRMHELTFRKALENAGLNRYMFEMANIREHDAWVHTDRKEATDKALDLIKGAIHRVRFHEALEKRSVEVNPATLIIGGGISGISAALKIADSGKKAFLVEKTGQLGGHVANVDLTFPNMYSAQQILKEKIALVENHPHIGLFLNTQVKEITGYIGNFEAEVLNDSGKKFELKFGNIVVATGLKPFDPTGIGDYGYGKFPNVITAAEFEKKLLSGNIHMDNGNIPRNVAIIHCVGSRNKDFHEYCSRTCCLTALKYANQVKSALPDANVYQLYADMRAIGKGSEEFYTETSKKEVMFLMYDQKNGLPHIRSRGHAECDMLIETSEKLSGEDIEICADLVILMTGMEARDDAKEIAHKVGVSTDGNGFFIEKHPKLDPVATTTDGVYCRKLPGTKRHTRFCCTSTGCRSTNFSNNLIWFCTG